MSEKPFKSISRDFAAINKLCGDGLSNKDASDFAKVASGIHSVLSNWQELMVESASQDKGASTHKNYNNIALSCTEDQYTKNFDILERDRLDALDILKKKDNAYLLTSLILAGSVAPHSMKSVDEEAYKTLKDYVQTTLQGNSPATILNDPRKASMALLVWNSIANMHLEALEVEILRNQLSRKEAGFKANANLTKELQKELDEVKTGKPPPTGWRPLMVQGQLMNPPRGQDGGGRGKRRASPKRRRRSASKKKRRRTKSRKKSRGRKKRS